MISTRESFVMFSSSSLLTVLIFIRSGTKLLGDVLADLTNVLQTELVQDGAHVTVDVLIGKLGLGVTGHVAAPVVVVLAVVPATHHSQSVRGEEKSSTPTYFKFLYRSGNTNIHIATTACDSELNFK